MAAETKSAGTSHTTPLPDGAVLLAQGAEARVYRASFLGRDAIVKERFKKAYRHPVLDAKLTRIRLLQEARSLYRCRSVGIDVPAILFLDENEGRIFMESVDGVTLKEYIFAHEDTSVRTVIARAAGAMIARLHNQDFVHGDLTTSNMLVRSGTSSLVLIDFGLSFARATPEDKAVDLYVLERAFSSTHPKSEEMFAQALDAYSHAVVGRKGILKKLNDVRSRGRKKLAFG